jgi:hypothetical protein
VTATPGHQQPFTERRYNALLSEPMVLQGHLSVTEDGVLRRVVEQPFPEIATIDGNRATLERDGRTREVDLGRRGPDIAYLRALYALLRGETEALQAEFDLSVSGDYHAWELLLIPASADLKRWLVRIRVSGSAEQVTRIRMEREDGAWQDLQLRRSPS